MSRPIASFLLLASLSALPARSDAQRLTLPRDATSDSASLAAAMPRLAREVLAVHVEGDPARLLADRIRLRVATGEHEAALTALAELRRLPTAPTASADPGLAMLEAYAAARQRATTAASFRAAFEDGLRHVFSRLTDREAHDVSWYLETPGFVFERNLGAALAGVEPSGGLDVTAALRLVRSWVAARMYRETQATLPRLIASEVSRRYVVEPNARVVTPDGATLSAFVIRPRAARTTLPAVLRFTIYTDTIRNPQLAREGAARGYVSVVVDARGKRLSSDAIRPYETEASDAYAVVDWISRQPWSDGRVAMYGQSYDGFAAWAATKRLHPALRTIATSAAAIPGLGLPMENSVFLNANYAWGFYVSNTRYLDDGTYGDRERWDTLTTKWYRSGRPHREIDQVDGTPNPLLQRWLQHPGYDAYWQSMVPYGADFARIDIPVLSITGYFDDGQISALEYAREHFRHRPHAEHYVVVGPYDHFGAGGPRKPPVVRGYAIDPVADFSTPALTFEWIDHVLKGAPRPALLKNRINHQVMGTNEWRHAPSFEALATERWRLHLTGVQDGAHRRLVRERPRAPGTLEQVVDLSDRTVEGNSYYPDPVLGRDPDFRGALTFASEPLSAPVELSGSFTGMLRLTTNKRDLDVNVVLYEIMPDGRLFHLSYFLGRASYAADPTTRRLLTPGAVASIPITRTRMTSRRLQAGSRLLVVLDVNRDALHQVNHGTGREVSDESVADAGEPLRVRWLTDSYLEVPIRR